MAQSTGAPSINGKSVIKETTVYEPVSDPTIVQPVSYAPPLEPVIESSGRNEAKRLDCGVAPEFFLQKIADLIWLILGVAIAFIGFRVVLKLIAADPANGFARFTFDLTEPLIAPFVGLAPTPSTGLLVFETYSVVAMMVYALMAWILVRLTWLIFELPSSLRYHDSNDR